MDKYVVIVAGGSGKRMASNTPKQFLEIGKLPILCHTINAFYQVKELVEIIVVLPENQIGYWKELCENYKFKIPHKIVPGGKSRFESVKNGIQSISNIKSLVAIHDGVRPFISIDIINKSFETAMQHGSGIVACKPKESIRKKTGTTTKAEDRSKFFSIQTPQTFRTDEIYKAYKVEEKDYFTDDASVAEDYGIEIRLVEGSDENIKITTQTDLIFAEALIQHRNKKSER